MSALLAAVIAIGSVAWLTRGLHLDGLVDTVDGFASMQSGQRAIAVMRDPQVGALGVVGVVVVLGGQIAGLAMLFFRVSPESAAALFVALAIASRAPLSWLARLGTPADQSGWGRQVVGRVGPAAALVSGLAASLGAGAVMLLTGVSVAASIAAVLVTWLAGAWVRRSTCRRFGVVTGDNLGASVELALLSAVLVLALAV